MKGDTSNMNETTMRRTRSVSALTLAGLSLAAALAGSMPASAATLGDEQHRPAIHFTPEKNWMNDPNGLVFHKGVYHMYYQHNPSGNTWGNMSWGHATSTDLVHWEEQPLAISTDAEEDVFSGSIVVDKNNTSGLGTAENPPLIAIYTSA
jgi:fructan beta-fructosidase